MSADPYLYLDMAPMKVAMGARQTIIKPNKV